MRTGTDESFWKNPAQASLQVECGASLAATPILAGQAGAARDSRAVFYQFPPLLDELA